MRLPSPMTDILYNPHPLKVSGGCDLFWLIEYGRGDECHVCGFGYIRLWGRKTLPCCLWGSELPFCEATCNKAMCQGPVKLPGAESGLQVIVSSKMGTSVLQAQPTTWESLEADLSPLGPLMRPWPCPRPDCSLVRAKAEDTAGQCPDVWPAQSMR